MVSCCYRYNPASGFNSSTLNISQIMVVKRVRGNRWSHVEAEASVYVSERARPGAKYGVGSFGRGETGMTCRPPHTEEDSVTTERKLRYIRNRPSNRSDPIQIVDRTCFRSSFTLVDRKRLRHTLRVNLILRDGGFFRWIYVFLNLLIDGATCFRVSRQLESGLLYGRWQTSATGFSLSRFRFEGAVEDCTAGLVFSVPTSCETDGISSISPSSSFSTPSSASPGLKELNKKWKNLRQCYKRERDSQIPKSGSAKKKKMQYIYFDVISFLAPVFTTKSTHSNVGDAEDGDEEEDGEMEEIPSVSQEVGTEKTSPAVQSSTAPSKRKRDSENPVADERMAAEKRKNEKEEADEDFNFLMSLLNYTRAVQEYPLSMAHMSSTTLSLVLHKFQQYGNRSQKGTDPPGTAPFRCELSRDPVGSRTQWKISAHYCVVYRHMYRQTSAVVSCGHSGNGSSQIMKVKLTPFIIIGGPTIANQRVNVPNSQQRMTQFSAKRASSDQEDQDHRSQVFSDLQSTTPLQVSAMLEAHVSYSKISTHTAHASYVQGRLQAHGLSSARAVILTLTRPEHGALSSELMLSELLVSSSLPLTYWAEGALAVFESCFLKTRPDGALVA
uniref:MADF domain-containing protein n=1 Tax=Timema douglasi TaxID=61478 RepID=A0A7R8VML8_TIMDO|nr:unnamed protein product [Timema douglasi]